MWKCCFSKHELSPSEADICVVRGTNMGLLPALVQHSLNLTLLYTVTSTIIGLLTMFCKLSLSRAGKEYFTEEGNIWTVF